MRNASQRREPSRGARLAAGSPTVVALKRRAAIGLGRTPTGLTIVSALACVIAVGTAALLLPPATVAGQETSPLTAFFTATSAACTTGLVVVDTADHWTAFGQVVILLLFQIGGLGFLTGSTLVLLALGRRLGLRDRLLIHEALGEGTLGGVGSLVRRIVLFAAITEAIGAVLLTAYFWRGRSPVEAAWFGVFHSVSAFTNASFDLMGDFGSFSDEHSPFLLLVICALIIAGGISFAVVADCLRARRLTRLTLDSKLVLITTAVLLGGGLVGIFVLERSNARTFGPLSAPEALLQSFFYAVVPRSAGFQTVPAAGFHHATVLLLTMLMFIGGAAGSTAGGIKVGSVAVLAAAVLSAMKGRTCVTVFWREVPLEAIMRALTVAVLAAALVLAATFVLLLTETFAPLTILFEVTSAFGTVGLSTGITPDLSTIGKLVLIVMMFVGRLGPLTLAVALVQQQSDDRLHFPAGTVRIG